MNPLDNIRVVLVEPATPGNIGATARVLKTTGINQLALVNPGAWDTPQARAFAHGAGDILDGSQVFPSLAAAVADCHIVVGTTHRQGRFRTVTSTPDSLIDQLASQVHHRRIALVFGRERDGLWHEELALCHQVLRFPTAVAYPSLNLSHAVLPVHLWLICSGGRKTTGLARAISYRWRARAHVRADIASPCRARIYPV